MNLAILAFALVLILLLLYWVFSPWLLPVEKAESTDPLLRKLEKLHFDREAIMQNLQDLELDRSLKKIDDSDYQNLKARMMSEAAMIYQNFESLEKSDPILLKLNELSKAKAVK